MKYLLSLLLLISITTIASDDCSFLEGRYSLESKRHATLTVDINDNNSIVAEYRSPMQPYWYWNEYYIADGNIRKGVNFQSGQEYEALCSENILYLTKRWNDSIFTNEYEILDDKLIVRSKMGDTGQSTQIFIRIK